MTMRELLDAVEAGKGGVKKIKYTPTVDSFRQLARVAAAQDVLIVNAGYTYNEELLLRLPEAYENVRVEAVDAASLAQAFEELSLEEREQCFELLKVAQLALQPFRAGADVKKFEPAELAALFTTDPDAQLARAVDQSKDAGESHITSMLDSILSGSMKNEPQAYLLFNYNAALVRQLATVRDPQLLRRCVEMLYVQALLLGHHPLSSRELNLLNAGLSDLIGSVLARKGEKP
jgi:molecular chaperone HtpG